MVTPPGVRGYLVLQAWWITNGLYPDKPLSEWLAMAEQSIRSLADQGLIALFGVRKWTRITFSIPV